MSDTAYVIAEASANHCGDVSTATGLVRAAAAAGADAVKFQTFTTEEICADVPILFGHAARHDSWCRRLGVTRMRDLFAKGGLPRAWHAPLKRLACDLGVEFLSTPFSVDAARFLVEEVGVPALKIASGDLTFGPLLEYANGTGLPVLLSTGGAYLWEVEAAAFGPLFPALRANRLCLLHCVSIYPCPDDEANVAALHAMSRLYHEADGRFYYPRLGYSDHTLSVDTVPLLALGAGARVFEKHLRLAAQGGGVDADHSLDEAAFAAYVQAIRDGLASLGHGEKRPQPGEMHDRLWARRAPIDWKRPTEAARAGCWA